MRRFFMVICTPLLVVAPAAAAAGSDTLSDVPATGTPQFAHGAVYDVAATRGRSVVVVGRNIGGVYRLNAGGVTWHVPSRRVQTALVVGRGVFVGTSTGVKRFDPPSRTPTWVSNLGGRVGSVERAPDGRLVVAGDFPGHFAMLGRAGHRDRSYTFPRLTGRCCARSGPVGVYRAAVQPGGTRYLAIGEFTAVNGVSRSQAVMLHLGRTRATLVRWDMPQLHEPCGSRTPAYLRDVKWNHAGTKVAIAASSSTGQFNRTQLCDSVSVSSGTAVSRHVHPLIEKTCKDTVHSVAFSPDDTKILAGGHFKCFRAAPGSDVVVPRYGVAMLDARTLALKPWKSDKCRGVGARAALWRPGGAWLGYDCGFWGNQEAINPDPTPQYPLARLAFLPAD